MGMRDWPLWRSGMFRNIKSLVESPKRSLPVIMISEMGVISRDHFPMATGFATEPNENHSYMVVHPLKIWLGDEPEQYQLISERSYFPLDPYGKFTAEHKRKLQSLTAIARMRHAERRQAVIQKNQHGAHQSLLQNIANWCFIIDAICLVIYFVGSRGGG